MLDLFDLFSLFLLPVISLLITVGVWHGFMGQRSVFLSK
jgi:hypothetical protein